MYLTYVWSIDVAILNFWTIALEFDLFTYRNLVIEVGLRSTVYTLNIYFGVLLESLVACYLSVSLFRILFSFYITCYLSVPAHQNNSIFQLEV